MPPQSLTVPLFWWPFSSQSLTFSIPKHSLWVNKVVRLFGLWCFADWWFGYLWRVEKEKSERKRKWQFDVEIFSPYMDKMIWMWTFPADPSTERVRSLAERVAYSRHPINLPLFNWRVPALLSNQITDGISYSRYWCSHFWYLWYSIFRTQEVRWNKTLFT